jgi:hypothetical protein
MHSGGLNGLIPLGSLECILFLAKICMSQPINIRIPDTIVCGRFADTKYLSNNHKTNTNENNNKYIKTISSSKLNSNEIEEMLCNWLQKNIEKSKKGSFVPVSIKKIKSRQDQGIETAMDFFVVSSIQNFNKGF